MGERGPIPKTSDSRIRRNRPDNDVVRGPGDHHTPAPFEPDPEWHPIATTFWESLENSGQSAFYVESDWATAYLLAEQMSRELKPQFIGMREMPTTWEINPATGEREMTSTGGTTPLAGVVPIKGASLTAMRAMMAVLLVTEGDRRRIQMELQTGPAEPTGPTPGQAAVASIQEHLMKKKKGEGAS